MAEGEAWKRRRGNQSVEVECERKGGLNEI